MQPQQQASTTSSATMSSWKLARSLEPSPVCQGHRVRPSGASGNLTGGVWMPLSRPYGPCSSEGETTAPPSSVPDALLWDRNRASYIQKKVIGETQPLAPSQPANTQQMSTDASTNNGLGQSATPSSLSRLDLAATGGSGRLPGVTQRMLGPYANGCTGGPNSGQCQYRVQYRDGSASSGTYISDVLTLTPTPAGVVNNFRFGCSHALQRPGVFSNTTAGIMALGRGVQSLLSQTKQTHGNVFSYCVPPTESHRGFFVLGVPRVAASRYILTPMLRSKLSPSLYLVRLQAITVAGQRLAVPPTVFAAGAVMDSRTVITRLQPTAYSALRAAFRAQMGGYRVAVPKGQLDTCYDFTSVRTVRLPKVALVFDSQSNGGAAVELDPSGILFNSCLAFASTGGGDGSTGIIGNVQQRTIEVLYNVGGSAVGFRGGAC
ncbi:unnamed protein product [Triticum turgidum subsp. durum]|uniref:Peptidase A1 domain-containing protein n=1 Tax=Triticum turgidum subsp. durum TaxID=4567 RepID=A0A9R1BHU3_TRITD|nr:unnamed protein product [Triticum turgidum subsp. durum]